MRSRQARSWMRTDISENSTGAECIITLNKIIKRVYKDDNNNNILTYDTYTIDLTRRIVLQNDKEIKLTTLEFDLLVLFIKNKEKCFTREEILDEVWGKDYFGSDRVVDDLVRRVRKKLPKLNVNSIYGYGYRLS